MFFFFNANSLHTVSSPFTFPSKKRPIVVSRHFFLSRPRILLSTRAFIPNSQPCKKKSLRPSFLSKAYCLYITLSFPPKPCSQPPALTHGNSFRPILSHYSLMLFQILSPLSTALVATSLHHYLFSLHPRHALARTHHRDSMSLLEEKFFVGLSIFAN